MIKGKIYKGIGGFYYVKAENGELIECKPRGIFRKTGQKPLAGDDVVLAQDADAFVIEEILNRKNAFVRPPVANVDNLFLVASTTQPVPSFLVLDKLCAGAIEQEVTPVILVTKTDLEAPQPLLDAYAQSGIECFIVDALSGEGVDRVRALLPEKLSVFCGNSGVGKSTLLNALCPGISRPVGEISQKLGRGKHTTREVELFEYGGGLVADTPGFASFNVHSGGDILAENMQLCFPEIKALIGGCRFSGCAHVAETGCAVKAALENGKISETRYNSYVELYKEAKEHEHEY